MNNSDVTNANVPDADPTDADVAGTGLADSDLVETDLADSDLADSGLADSDLAGSDLAGSEQSSGSKYPPMFKLVTIGFFLMFLFSGISYYLSITAWLWLPFVFPAFWQQERRFSMRLLLLFTALEAAALVWFIRMVGRPL